MENHVVRLTTVKALNSGPFSFASPKPGIDYIPPAFATRMIY